MRIIETYCEGKSFPEACEDRIVCSQDFAAVIDGATDKGGPRLGNLTGGAFVAQLLANLIGDPEKLPPDSSFEDFAKIAAKAVRDALAGYGWPTDVPSPAASVVVFSAARMEVWRIGDCHFSVDGTMHSGDKAIDARNSAIRSMVLATLYEIMPPEEILASGDPGRDAIMPILKAQRVLANNAHSSLGYPVVNGMDVPGSLLEEPVPVRKGGFVVLASDGFDFPAGTLDETLVAQATSYASDPMRIGLPGGKASTKGIMSGASIHDDRAYVSLVA